MKLIQSLQDLCIFPGVYQQLYVKLLSDFIEAINFMNALSGIKLKV